jgi:hypothetical protein
MLYSACASGFPPHSSHAPVVACLGMRSAFGSPSTSMLNNVSELQGMANRNTLLRLRRLLLRRLKALKHAIGQGTPKTGEEADVRSRAVADVVKGREFGDVLLIFIEFRRVTRRRTKQ